MHKLRNRVGVEAACETIACGECGVHQLCGPLGVDEHMDSVLESIIKRRVTFRCGDLLYRMGQPFEHVYALRSGSVKTYVSTDDGRVQITGFHVAGELLGLNAMNSGLHTSEARALETTMACEVAVDRLEQLAKRTPDLHHERRNRAPPGVDAAPREEDRRGANRHLPAEPEPALGNAPATGNPVSPEHVPGRYRELPWDRRGNGVPDLLPLPGRRAGGHPPSRGGVEGPEPTHRDCPRPPQPH